MLSACARRILGRMRIMTKHKDRTFDEIARKHGEEAAINAGIAADPDTFEADAEWFKEARPAHESIPI